MKVTGLVGMIDATFQYFGALGDWHQDPVGVDAVRAVRDRMVADLESFREEPSKDDVAQLCRDWRALRLEPTGEASYPPDIFIESVCQVIEIS